MSLDLFTTNRSSSANLFNEGPTDLSPLTTVVSRAAYVSRDVLPGKGGRLHYLSTEWGAYSMDNSFIAAGTLVQPVSRRGNSWVVAAVESAQPNQAA